MNSLQQNRSPYLEVFAHDRRCYFNYYDKNPKRREEGILRYHFQWWGRLWEILGFATSLKGFNGKIYYVDKKDLEKWINRHHGSKQGSYPERIAEICKKQLELSRRKIRNEIIQKGRLYTKRAQRREIKRVLRERKVQELVSTFIKNLKIKVKTNQKRKEELIKEEGAKCLAHNTYRIEIDDEFIIANPSLMKTSHFFRHFLMNQENLSKEDKVKKRVVELKMFRTFACENEQQSAPEQKSSQVISKETKNITKPQQTHYTFDNQVFEIDSVEYPVNEINGQAFEILKVFLETEIKNSPASGNENEGSQAKDRLEGELLHQAEKNILPLLNYESILALYELHQVLDISGIIEIIHRNIDFYSNDTLIWETIEEKDLTSHKENEKLDLSGDQVLAQDVVEEKTGVILGRKDESLTPVTIKHFIGAKVGNISLKSKKNVSCQQFWLNVAEKYHDIDLKNLCTEKYYGLNLIYRTLETHNNSRSADSITKSCSFQVIVNSVGSINLVLKFNKIDQVFLRPETIIDSYKNHLKILTLLSEEECQKAKLKTITIDFSSVASNEDQILYANYIANLLQEINNHFDPPFKLEQRPNEGLIPRVIPSDFLNKEIELILYGLNDVNSTPGL